MSGNSYGASCPNCNDEMSVYEDHKPFAYVGGECNHCGFYLHTTTNQLGLEQLNENRNEYNHGMNLKEDDEDYLVPLTELPKFDDQFKSSPTGA